MPGASGGIEGTGNLNRNINLAEDDSVESFVLNQNAEQINSAAAGGNKPPLDALMMAIMVERAELIESQLRDQVDQVRGKNSQLKEANNVMAMARTSKRQSTDKKKSDVPEQVNQFLKDNNIPWGKKDSGDLPGELKSSQWDLLIENLKGWSESLTSTSQLQMTKLQSTSGKFNQTFEMLSQFVSKYYRGGDSIIKNI